MIASKHNNINQFWVVGINYKKTDALIRGHFAINAEQYANILAMAPQYGVKELFVLSTCNRTELYGCAESATDFFNLIASQCPQSLEVLTTNCYAKNSSEAIHHLFKVAAGLDSQILGDYEILGQIKIAVKFAKEKGFIGPFLERLLNCVLQSSKAIKTKTMLSGGTVSVSFAAIQYIKEHIADVCDKKIMLLGTGKIGRITCKNIVDYLKTRNITLINRTEEKALQIAEELGLKHASMENLDAEIAAADIIIVATNATTPTILKGHLEYGSEKLIIDLSVPCNVAADAQQLGNITFINVDDLSKIKDETLQKRQEEVPKALEIIDEHIEEFVAWHNMRKYAPLLKEVKNKLKDLNTHPVIKDIAIYNGDSEEKIQKVINVLAIKMRSNNTPGCQYIAAINEYIA